MKKTFNSLFQLLVCCCLLAFYGQSVNAQCAFGETEYLVVVDAGAGGTTTYPNEYSWEIQDAGGNTIIAEACGYLPNATTGVQAGVSVCLTDGQTYTLIAYDDWGDAWNGGTISLTLADGSNVVTPTNPSDNDAGDNADDCVASQIEQTWSFTAGAGIEGCTDLTASNYNPDATVDDGSCTFCGDLVCDIEETICDCADCLCDAVFLSLNLVDNIISTTPILSCPTDVGGVNDGSIYYGFVLNSSEELCVALDGNGLASNFGLLATTNGSFYDSFTPPVIAANDSVDGYIKYLNLTQAEIDNAIANTAGIVTISYQSNVGNCAATIDIDVNSLGAGGVDAQCPLFVCGANGCEEASGEDYCNCDVDCPCSFWSDANGWDATSNIQPVLLLNGGNGFGGVKADVDSLAVFSTTPGPLYCQKFFGAAENNDTITLAFAVFDDLSCVGEIATPYNITTTSGTFSSSGASTGTLTEATIGYIDLVQADIDASGGTTTITFDDPAGGCSANMVIDWSWFGNPSTLVADSCPPCAETSGSTITSPICSGENFSVTMNGCSAPSGEVFALIYDLDSTFPTTQDSLYNYVMSNDYGILDNDLIWYGHFSDCTNTGFIDLPGFLNLTCDVLNIDVYLMPVDTTNSLVEPTCAIEGPLTLTIYPSYEVVTSDGLSCTPTANLYATYDTLNADNVTIDKVLVECASAGDLTTDCSTDLTYDFTTNVAAGATCIAGDLTGTVACTCSCPVPAFAGNDTTVTVCDNITALNLQDLQSPGATAGGIVIAGSASITIDPSALGEGTYTFTLEVPSTDATNALCTTDVVDITVMVAGATTTSETFSTCSGTSYDYNGTMIMAGTSMDFTATGANGCDSIHTVMVTSIEPIDATEEATICAGDSYTASTGTVYTESGSEAIVDANNCAATLTVTITVNTPIDATEEATICAGDSYTASTGTVYTESGSEAIVDANNCAATLAVTITTNTPIDVTEEATICAGGSYVAVDGTVFTESGTITATDANGCSYELTVNLTIGNPDNQTEEATICPGSSYEASTGTVYTESGSEVVADASGCEFTLNVNITVATPIDATEEATICAGGSYEASTGTMYTESGSEAIIDANGCDATLTVTITINEPVDVAESADLCDDGSNSFTSPTTGTVYTESGSETITDANGCEATLTVTITPITCTDPCDAVTDQTEEGTICAGDSYEASTGTMYTESGSEEITDGNGCTYTLTVTLTINAPVDVAESADLCDDGSNSFTSPTTGTVYTESGSETITDANGCDATLTVTITLEDCTVPCDVVAGTISADVSSVCVGNAIVNVTIDDAGISENSIFVITDGDGTTILGTPSTDSGILDLSAAPAGTCQIWLLNYDGEFTAPASGLVADLTGCLVLSNAIDIVRNDVTADESFEATLCLGEGGSHTTPSGMVYDESNPSGTETLTDANGCDYNYTVTLTFTDCTVANCDDFGVSVSGVCNDSDTEYTLAIAIAGVVGDTYTITSSSDAALNGTTVSGSFNAGPFAVGSAFNYTITSVGNADCTATISASQFVCTTTAIELIEFAGRTLGNANEIYWTTATESDNDFFTLERSSDGVNFDVITNVNGSGTTSTPTAYSFIDNNVGTASFYRLLATDYNGVTEVVSKVIELTRASALTVNVHPVPANDVINIELGISANDVSVLVIDITGKVVKSVDYAGENQNMQLNINDLSAGTYFLQVQHTNGEFISTKFIKK